MIQAEKLYIFPKVPFKKIKKENDKLHILAFIQKYFSETRHLSKLASEISQEICERNRPMWTLFRRKMIILYNVLFGVCQFYRLYRISIVSINQFFYPCIRVVSALFA